LPILPPVRRLAGTAKQFAVTVWYAVIEKGTEKPSSALGNIVGWYKYQVTASDVPSGFLRHDPAYKKGG